MTYAEGYVSPNLRSPANAGFVLLGLADSAGSGSTPALWTAADPARPNDLAGVVNDTHLSSAFASEYVAGSFECPLLGLGVYGAAPVALSQNVPAS